MAVTVLDLMQGEVFRIGKERFVLEEVISESHFKVRRVRDGAVWEINGFSPREVVQEAFAFGLEQRRRRPAPKFVKVAIEAPPHVLLLRGDNYRKAHPESEVVAKATSSKGDVVRLLRPGILSGPAAPGSPPTTGTKRGRP